MLKVEGSKCLVVGGAGFVGSNCVQVLLEDNPKSVLVVDNLLSAEASNIPNDSRVDFIEGSITEDRVLNQLPRDLNFVFHLATFHGNQNSMARPLEDHENNTYTTLRLYDHIRDFAKLKKVVYSSAGCTVAQKTFEKAKATTEEDPVSLWLDTPYQMSKIFGEFYSNYYTKTYKLPVVKARFQNVYGPGEILGAGRWRGTEATVWRNVIPSFVYRALKRMPLKVENGGIASRDFIFAKDIARGLVCCAIHGGVGECYNLASGDETTILELANAINDIAKNPTPIDFSPARSWDRSGKRYAAIDKSRDQIHFEAKVKLLDGLRTTIDWTRETMPTIEACIQKHASHMKMAA